MKPTIKDVAGRAGVSIATVSHVVNHTRVVTDETRERVLRAIGELGYTPNLRARNFKTGRNNAICIVTPDISNRFFAPVIEEIEDVVSRHGYYLMIANTKENKQRELGILRYFSTGIVDGIILASTFDDYGELAPALPRDIPLVFFDRKLPGCPYDTVTINDAPVIRQATAQMAAAGRRRIGCIAGLPRLSTTQERVDAYREGLRQAGLPADGRYIRYADGVGDDGAAQAKQLLAAGCTAFLAVSNVMTQGLLRCLLDAGLTPGGEVLVAGYHDADLLGIDMIRLELPSRGLGRQIGERMLARIEEPAAPAQRIELVSESAWAGGAC